MIYMTDVFKVFQQHRGDAITVWIAKSAPGRKWLEFTTNEKRDLNLSGAMGQTVSAAFGVALSLPDEKIVIFDGEGSLLMNLGILATIADKQPGNFYHFLLDNECYATTGGQPVPNAKKINYAGMAKEAGYAATYQFEELEPLNRQMEEILSQKGPVFVAIKVVPEIENKTVGRAKRSIMPTRTETIQTLQKELGIA